MSTEGAELAHRARRALPTIALALAAAWTVHEGVQSRLHEARTRAETRQRIKHGKLAEAQSYALLADAVLPSLADAIPRDARVLVVTSGLVIVGFDYWLRPRGVDIRYDFPQAILDLAKQHASPLLGDLVARRKVIQDLGLLLDADALQDSEQRFDYLLCFAWPAAGRVPGATWEELKQSADATATLYRRR